MTATPQFSLVLGGGGLKGLAHIGVLRALEEHGLTPSAVIGCSIGSLIGAAWAAGMPVSEMEDRALRIQRKNIFRVAHFEMAFRRLLSPGIYRSDPLDQLIHSLVGGRTFEQLARTLVVNTVDINTGQQMFWGLPGLRRARVADAVFASCALPGMFPPRQVQDHFCVDGAVIENLPVRAALAVCSGPIVAVDVGGAGGRRAGIERMGFAATYTRGLEIVMQTITEELLRDWVEPPIVLVRPRVERIPMFAFNRTPYLIVEGYRALNAALDSLPKDLGQLPAGIHPQREVEIKINRKKCVSCGVCWARAPETFARGAEGKAEVREPVQWWSPLGEWIEQACPTGAISADQRWPPKPRRRSTSGGHPQPDPG